MSPTDTCHDTTHDTTHDTGHDTDPTTLVSTAELKRHLEFVKSLGNHASATQELWVFGEATRAKARYVMVGAVSRKREMGFT